MSTSAQIQANQQNAQHSTGPVTPQGKATAARNNFRHGFRGHFSLLPHENPDDFAALLQGLREEHQPATLTEELLVERLAEHEWLSRRAQTLLDESLNAVSGPDTKAFALWLRYQTTHHRGFHKCLADLRKLQSDKRKQEIGFERQKHEQAEQARRQQVAEARTRALKAQAANKELDTEIRAMLQAPLPGHTPIDFAEIKPFLNRAIDHYFQAQALEARASRSAQANV